MERCSIPGTADGNEQSLIPGKNDVKRVGGLHQEKFSWNILSVHSMKRSPGPNVM
jgi:hypothetical protein